MKLGIFCSINGQEIRMFALGNSLTLESAALGSHVEVKEVLVYAKIKLKYTSSLDFKFTISYLIESKISDLNNNILFQKTRNIY